MDKIVLKNLNKYFNRHTRREIHVINNTSLTLPNCGLICLLGESGSGKTTLLNTIGGIDKADNGQIFVDGELFNYKNKQGENIRRNKFAYIFQNYYLVSNLTVYENLVLALEPYRLTEEEISSRIDYVLEKVGMIRYKKRGIKNLSGGQIQRVAIARALIKSPEVIFADEPTGNLDEATTIEVMMILKKISKSCLVIMATHEKNIANFFADRILQLEDGKIVSDTTIENANRVYDDFDDNNIYLKEFEEKKVNLENNNFTIYSNDESALDLKVIHANNKYYLSGQNIEIIDDKSSIKIVDSKKPIRRLNDVEQFDYNLDKTSKTNSGKLSFKNFFKKLLNSSRRIGFKIMVITMVLISILFVLGVGDYLTLSSDKTSTLVKSDLRCVTVTLSKGQEYDTLLKEKYVQSFIDLYEEEMGDEILIPNTMSGHVNLESFYQVEGLTKEADGFFYGFSYMPIEYLNSNQVIYGRMPENPHEVVVDKWVVEQYMNKESILFQTFTDVRDFIGMRIDVCRNTYQLEIVGICESNNMSLYIDKYSLISSSMILSNFCSLDALKKTYPEKFGDVVLEDEQIIVNGSDLYANISVVRTCNSMVSFYNYGVNTPTDFPYTYVITENGYKRVRDYIINIYDQMVIVTDNTSKIVDYVDKIINSEDPKYDLVHKLQIDVKNQAQDIMDDYNTQNNKKIFNRSIILSSIFAICLISLFITMKAHANENMENTMVYRLLGMKKGVVIGLAAAEIVALSLIVIVPSSLILIGILKFITQLPSVKFAFIFTPLAYFVSLSAILLINVLIGILPVVLILRKTSAELVSKYDI